MSNPPTHSKDNFFGPPTKEELEKWAALQKAKYWRGLLKPKQIKKLEALPNWNWGEKPKAEK